MHPKFTMAAYQHVLDVSAETDVHLTELLGCAPSDAFAVLTGRSIDRHIPNERMSARAAQNR
jgi:hypothetical protein